MNIPKFLFVSIFSFIILIGNSQVQVKDVSELIAFPEAQLLQDVNGKVLISDDYLCSLKTPLNSKAFEIYAGWPMSFSGSSQRGGISCNLDSDPELEIIYCIGQQVYAWNMDGSLVDGWPVTAELYPDGAPAFGDIDGDGIGDVVVSTRQPGTGNVGRIMAWHLDGSLVDGFPIILGGGATKTPVLADLDDDNVMEIIVEERDYPDGYVGVYYGDGTSFPGFPVALDYIPGSAVAVGDITGDNIPEIVAESYYSIFAFDIYGNVLEGFPFTPGNDRVFSYSTPVLADIDGDGFRDIIAGDHSLSQSNGAVHVLSHTGVPLDGWPKYTSWWIYGPAAVGDIDGDGSPDIAIGDQILSPSPTDKVFAWDHAGNLLPGWPTDPINAINNQILLVDIDNDDAVELIWDDNTNVGAYIGYNHDGTPMAGWPLPVLGSTFFMNPFITDIDNDGNYDMSGGGKDLSTNELNLYLWDANVPVKPQYSPLTVLQYNVRHDGVYVDASTLNCGFTASPTNICQESQTTFADESTGDVNSWLWTFDGGTPATSTDQNPVVFYNDPGLYDVSLEVSDGTSNSSMVKTDYIHVSTDAEIPGQPTGPFNFSTDTLTYTFYETTSANADEYIWELDPPDVGVIVDGDTMNQVKIYWSSANNYSAQLKVKSANVCGESNFSEPLTVYVNWISGTETALRAKPYEIFPNPGNGKFYIDFHPENKGVKILILNSYGKLLNKVELSDNKEIVALDYSHLPTGLYYVIIKTKNSTYFEKVVFVD